MGVDRGWLVPASEPVVEVRSAIRDIDVIESLATTRILGLINAEPAVPVQER